MYHHTQDTHDEAEAGVTETTKRGYLSSPRTKMTKMTTMRKTLMKTKKKTRLEKMKMKMRLTMKKEGR
jgi:hypothetical protein